MPSIFTKIIAGEIPCHQVGETEDCFAFLDIRPWREGHTLVVPKQEVDQLFDLEPELYRKVMDFSRDLAHAIRDTVPCDRVGVLVEGLEVAHAHVHLIPIVDGQFHPSQLVEFTQEEYAETAAKIAAALA